MFAASQLMVVNKIDLLPYVDYNVERVKRQALTINSHLHIFELIHVTEEDRWRLKWDNPT